MTIHRVTQSMLTDRSLSNLQGSLSRLAEIQEHLSTGRVLNRPSDDPADAASAMRLRSAVAAQQQYARNAQDGLGWLNTMDATLQGSIDQVTRARDLALQGINGSMGPAAREALAVEVEQIREGLLAAANTNYLGRPIFGGTTAGSVAYAVPDPVDPLDPTAVAYAGDTNPVRRTVAEGVTVEIQLAGTEAFGADGANVFSHLTALAAALRAGDVAGMEVGIESLTTDGHRLTTALADVGTRARRIEQAELRATDAELGLANSLSEIENADLPKTVVELQMQEVAYQAALAATGRVLQPSLLDFLR